MKSVADNPELT